MIAPIHDCRIPYHLTWCKKRASASGHKQKAYRQTGQLVTGKDQSADDAAIKKQLIGRWETPGGVTELKADGTMLQSGFPGPRKWDVRNGVFYDHRDFLQDSLPHENHFQDPGSGTRSSRWYMDEDWANR